MKPFHHARMDVKMFGGKKEDYYDIHEFIDSSYHVCPDIRHRALLHNQFGLMMVELLPLMSCTKAIARNSYKTLNYSKFFWRQKVQL